MDIFHLKSGELSMYNKPTYNCFLRLFTTRNIYYHIAQVQPLPHWDSVLSVELHDSADDILEIFARVGSIYTNSNIEALQG